jgi:hypothetical protein
VTTDDLSTRGIEHLRANRGVRNKEQLAQALRDGDTETFTAAIREANDPRVNSAMRGKGSATWGQLLDERSLLGDTLRAHREAIEAAFGYRGVPQCVMCNGDILVGSDVASHVGCCIADDAAGCCAAGLDYGESRETLTTGELSERLLREDAAADRWSFKQGSLRERLEWCRVQHELGAEWLDGVAAMPPESRPANPPKPAEWHRACAEWYAQMVRDLDAILATFGPISDTDLATRHDRYPEPPL